MRITLQAAEPSNFMFSVLLLVLVAVAVFAISKYMAVRRKKATQLGTTTSGSKLPRVLFQLFSVGALAFFLAVPDKYDGFILESLNRLKEMVIFDAGSRNEELNIFVFAGYIYIFLGAVNILLSFIQNIHKLVYVAVALMMLGCTIAMAACVSKVNLTLGGTLFFSIVVLILSLFQGNKLAICSKCSNEGGGFLRRFSSSPNGKKACICFGIAIPCIIIPILFIIAAGIGAYFTSKRMKEIKQEDASNA